MKVLIVVGVTLTMVLAPGAGAGGPRMLIGAVDQNALQPTDDEAAAQVKLATDAGLGGAIRVTLTWARGRRAPEQANVAQLRNAVDAAARTGTTAYVALYPFGSSQTPLSDDDQSDFIAWVTAIA